MSFGTDCLTRIQDSSVIDLPQIHRWCQIERTVRSEQIGLHFLVVAIDKRGAEPIARVRACDVQVDVLFVRVNTADLAFYVDFCQTTWREVFGECIIVR